MAKKSSSRRTHVSPGIYYKETELQYATKSLGITTLGLAGETVKGPAFQTISISDWREFQTYFGGTNTEKFRGSQYPKYELPYIAQEYLKQSKQLEVVRTLGLSGVNAGPAWVITATKHECGNGYKFEQEFDPTDGSPIDITSTPYLINAEDTCVVKKKDNDIIERIYKNVNYSLGVSFSMPEPVLTKTTDPNPFDATIGVMEPFVNTNADILYINQNDSEDYFNILPEGIKKEFGTYKELEDYVKANSWGDAIFYIGLDNKLYDGQVVVTFELGEKGVIALKYDDIQSGALLTVGHDDTDYASTVLNTAKAYIDADGNSYKYIIVPKSELDTILTTALGVYDAVTNPNGYSSLSDFNISRFKVYQYGYSNQDAQGQKLVAESGRIYQYNSVQKDTVCVEDKTADYANIAIAVLRSRGEHKKSMQSGVDECGNPTYTFDGIEYYAKKVTLEPSSTLVLGDTCNPGYNTTTGDFNIDASNYGKFNILIDSIKGCELCGIDSTLKNRYSVSLNPNDKNYITKVFGTDPEVGDAEVYVEELYDIALEQLIIANEINAINHEVVKYPYVNIVPDHEPVDDLLTIDESNLTKRHVGKRYLYTYAESLQDKLKVRITTDGGNTWTKTIGIVGHIYTVKAWTNPTTNKKEYFYGEYRNENGGILEGKAKFTEFLTFYQYYRDIELTDGVLRNCVKVKSDDCYYVYADFYDNDMANEGDVRPITLDFNNYKDEYRYASTPWIVSEMKGTGNDVKLHKLFRFHTISDGNESNTEVKVSIENIDPDNEVFDVVIRSFYDSDINPQILERFGKCSLKPGESNYLGLKIGDIEGTYVSQSAYVTVEINEDDVTAMSVPCGFLGYPVRNYNGFGLYDMGVGETLSTSIKQPYLKYNTTLDSDIKVKKQYFGMSDLLGIDEDILSYKGVEAYNEDPEYLTPCFHLDSRILNGVPTIEEKGVYYVQDIDETNTETARQSVSVDGITGYTWITVSRGETTTAGIEPRIGGEEVMENTIYEDKAARKFTLCFYGGWDGWDYYRTSRSNSDEYRANKYKGSINSASGQGIMFSNLKNPEAYGFDSTTKAITSDYYAYLAAVRQLDNPKTVTINLFATPGIDYVNQTALVQDIIDIVEEDRGDTLYLVTTPDKPFGAGDSKSEMYTPEEIVYKLEDTEIDTNYACTYYPWEQYFDSANNQYIYLPVTLDVVRNMAYTDNIAYPWYASAGWNRGDITGVGPKRKLKLGEQDTLYEGRINFINSFAKEGDRIWGDKNLQVHDGIMNRISKRRLLIRLKNLLSTACVGLLFDPNDPQMAETFKSSIKAVLDPIKTTRGITDYRIEVDDSAEARDRLELPAKIYIKPTQMLEYIDIDLVVTPQGVNWL